MNFEETKEANDFLQKAKNGEMTVNFSAYHEISRELKQTKQEMLQISSDFKSLVDKTAGMLESVNKLNDELMALNRRCLELFEESDKGEKQDVETVFRGH